MLLKTYDVTRIPGTQIMYTAREYMVRWPNGEVDSMKTTPLRTPEDTANARIRPVYTPHTPRLGNLDLDPLV